MMAESEGSIAVDIKYDELRREYENVTNVMDPEIILSIS